MGPKAGVAASGEEKAQVRKRLSAMFSRSESSTGVMGNRQEAASDADGLHDPSKSLRPKVIIVCALGGSDNAGGAVGSHDAQAQTLHETRVPKDGGLHVKVAAK